MSHPHFLLVTCAAQGHINPALQFAKRLVGVGVNVTFATTISAVRCLSKNHTLNSITFAQFSDGSDDGLKPMDLSELKRRGTETLSQIIASSADQGRPVTCLVYTLLLPWAARLARELHVLPALLWIQPATVLDIYYYYFNGYGELIRSIYEDPSSYIGLAGLPLVFTSRDLPSFLEPSTANSSVLPTFEDQLDALYEETNPKILVNTFDALEPEALTAVDKFNLIAIGPLMPSAFLDGKDPSDTSFGCDLSKCSKDYIQWLDSKPELSVIYVSFGSISVLSKRQIEEMAYGLLESQRPFLWVITEPSKEGEEKEEDKLSCREELEEVGMIIPWCSQVEVLSHPSLGCFLTHCGWNSTMESLVSGVPVVAFPQWTDQGTNSKLIQDAWKTGVRVNANEEGIVGRDEIRRCLDMVMDGGKRGEDLRQNANKWKDLARQAVEDGGSSDKNLKAFVDKVTREFQP